MSELANPTAPAVSARRLVRPATALAAAAVAALLAGCANRDSVTVGSIPDDYRTNHPIVIAEKEEKIDLVVGTSDRGATRPQKAALEGFLAGYDRTAAPVLRIMTPQGASNDVAAAEAAHDFARIARKDGVPDNRIMIVPYQAGSAEVPAPVRVSFTAVRAQTNKCGRWPDDILKNADNKHYANYGCSMQNNVAAQLANPEDLLGPRKQTPIDAANRTAAIDNYQTAPADRDFEPNIGY